MSMSKEQLKQTGEALIAASEGKSLQYQNAEGTWIDDFHHIANMLPRRIKPEPTKRPIHVSELPIPCLVKADYLPHPCLVTAYDPDRDLIELSGREEIAVDELYNKHAQFSSNGREWHEFAIAS